MNIVKWAKSSLLALGGVILLTGPALAARPHHYLREKGIIQTINQKATTLTTKDLRTDAVGGVVWNEKTQFWEKKKPILPGDLRAGEKVAIRYAKRRAGDLVAQSVLVLQR